MPDELFDADADECPVCGRVVDPEASEFEMLPGELACQGCHAHIKALLLEEDPIYEMQRVSRLSRKMKEVQIGTRARYTAPQAHAIAKSGHERREIQGYHAGMRKRLGFIIKGESGDGDGKLLKAFNWQDKRGLSHTLTVAEQKAQGVKMLNQVVRQEAALLKRVEGSG